MPHETEETNKVYLATRKEVQRIAREFHDLYGTAMVFRAKVDQRQLLPDDDCPDAKDWRESLKRIGRCAHEGNIR